MTFTANELDPSNRFCGRGESTARQEQKRREALWDLFQSEIVFLLDHLMVLRHVSPSFDFERDFQAFLGDFLLSRFTWSR